MMRSLYRLTKRKLIPVWCSYISEQKLQELKKEYFANPTLKVFQGYINSSSDYFRIFKIMHETKFNESAYQNLLGIVAKIQPQTDNVILLQSKILAGIAAQYQKKQQYQTSKAIFLQAIQCIQNSRVPQVMQYYTLYRRYGLLLAQMKDQDAKQVLIESVTIINQFIQNSEDPVTGVYNSIQQAKAAINLYFLDNYRQQWLKMATEQWKHCQGQEYQHKQYAQTVIEYAKSQITANEKNRNRMKLFLDVELQKMVNQKECDILRKEAENI